ncbi:phosphate/phosphite/phosphonate ABC transporter substrate-binding protein [Tahibacter amnicola]|uniref:Phosphate/phosphite/phosphonate ABC transporter substrate-binding protein n=1 Tax=Tahibacter amnicola TaxID=2976241 RepID=A0ABY6B9G1_9GAMM|nr:phosphate/phosphite/phosphonate ABC transporter substrate-binding protein [Tahibacter amnicola]UXI66696.1 phosphate/phosphite/phosphonate ABC transporter substrate-binding protein [Tahibacter amnicola]
MSQRIGMGQRLMGFCAAAVLLAAPAVAADYTFAVEPIYPPEKATEVYRPLVDYLAKATGERFTLVTPKNYHFYWRDMRQNQKVDFSLDEAHLADYRIARFKYLPLVRTAENQSYTLVTNVDLQDRGLEALVGTKIVCMGAPSLGYALLLGFYPNPIQQPDIESSAASWRDAVEAVFAGEAQAAMIPTWLKDQYPNLTPVKTSREFAGAAISASATVPEDVRSKVTQALLKLDQDPSLSNLLLELGTSKFVPANVTDYTGSETMLKDFYGYQ